MFNSARLYDDLELLLEGMKMKERFQLKIV